MSDYLDTTRAERLTIAKIVDPSMLDIDTASKMLYRLWDDNFGMSKQTVISAEEAEDDGSLPAQTYHGHQQAKAELHGAAFRHAGDSAHASGVPV